MASLGSSDTSGRVYEACAQPANRCARFSSDRSGLAHRKATRGAAHRFRTLLPSALHPHARLHAQANSRTWGLLLHALAAHRSHAPHGDHLARHDTSAAVVGIAAAASARLAVAAILLAALPLRLARALILRVPTAPASTATATAAALTATTLPATAFAARRIGATFVAASAATVAIAALLLRLALLLRRRVRAVLSQSRNCEREQQQHCGQKAHRHLHGLGLAAATRRSRGSPPRFRARGGRCPPRCCDQAQITRPRTALSNPGARARTRMPWA